MSYLAIVKNQAEISRDGFERTGGACGVSHPTKQFGRGVVRFLLICGGVWFEGLAGTSGIVGKDRDVCMSEEVMREAAQNDHVHVPSGFPSCGIEGTDGEGWLPLSTPLCSLLTATSASAVA